MLIGSCYTIVHSLSLAAAGNRSRVDECRDHPYMRPSPFMHLQGQLPGGVQLLKDGRLAHGMDINGAAADPRLSLPDVCNPGEEK